MEIAAQGVLSSACFPLLPTRYGLLTSVVITGGYSLSLQACVDIAWGLWSLQAFRCAARGSLC